jgi:hypothetical protein
MSSDQELRLYLDSLLNHSCAPDVHPCTACDSLNRILQAVKSHIFSGVIYPEVTLRARSAQN